MTNSEPKPVGAGKGTIPLQVRQKGRRWKGKAEIGRTGQEAFTRSFIHFWVGEILFFAKDALIFNARKLIRRLKNQ